MSQPERKMTPQEENVWFKVRVALKVDPETESFYKDLKIHVTRGVVTLSGTAPSVEAAAHAERVALAVADVNGVDNQITTAG